MLRYKIFAILACFPYILGGTDTPHPDTTFKLHEFEFGALIKVRGSNRVRFQREVVAQNFKHTGQVFLYTKNVVCINQPL